MYRVIPLLLLLALLLPVSTVYADDEYRVPPGLDSIGTRRWLDALPTARPYLARLYDIPSNIAEKYGAVYKTPSCMSGAVNTSTVEPAPIVSSYETSTLEWTAKPMYIKAPPQLSGSEAIRWMQSLPSARFYLAKLYGVPLKVAIEYGAGKN